MKNTIRIFTMSAFFLALCAAAFAHTPDKLDAWLDKYDTFVEKVEKSVPDKATSKIQSFYDEREALIKEKDNLQKTEGNFTFKQGLRYGEINARWGIAIGALHTTKGVKKAADSVNEFLEEEN